MHFYQFLNSEGSRLFKCQNKFTKHVKAVSQWMFLEIFDFFFTQFIRTSENFIFSRITFRITWFFRQIFRENSFWHIENLGFFSSNMNLAGIGVKKEGTIWTRLMAPILHHFGKVTLILPFSCDITKWTLSVRITQYFRFNPEPSTRSWFRLVIPWTLEPPVPDS